MSSHHGCPRGHQTSGKRAKQRRGPEAFARHGEAAALVTNVLKACERLGANEPLRTWEKDAISTLIGRYATVGDAGELLEATVTSKGGV